MSDVVFLLITVLSFVLMALLVGVIDRRLDERPSGDERARG